MMIAVLGKPGGRRLLVIGLDAENVRQLTSGKAARFDGRAQGIPLEFCIVYGATLESIAETLRAQGINVPDMPAPTPGNPTVWKKEG